MINLFKAITGSRVISQYQAPRNIKEKSFVPSESKPFSK